MIRRVKVSRKIGLILLSMILLGLFLLSLFVGVYDLTQSETAWKMLLITRLPRTLALVLTGASMALSGYIMQLLTQNRFVEPTTMGTMEWAGLGLILAYIINPAAPLVFKMSLCIGFSILGSLVFLRLVRHLRFKQSVLLPLVGILSGAVISAFSNFLALQFNLNQMLEVWFTASFASVQQGRYEYLWLIIGIVIIFYKLADELTIAGLGEEIASNLGVDYTKITFIGVFLVSVSVGIVAAVVGYLPFIGLIIPNIVAIFWGDHLKHNLPFILILGMICLLVCDLLARWLIMPFEVPVSTVLAMVGSMTFIGLLYIQRKKGLR